MMSGLIREKAAVISSMLCWAMWLVPSKWILPNVRIPLRRRKEFKNLYPEAREMFI